MRRGEQGYLAAWRKGVVKACGQFARELEVLGLVFADGDMRRVVQEDVGGLQDRVGEEAELDGWSAGGAAGLEGGGACGEG